MSQDNFTTIIWHTMATLKTKMSINWIIFIHMYVYFVLHHKWCMLPITHLQKTGKISTVDYLHDASNCTGEKREQTVDDSMLNKYITEMIQPCHRIIES